MTNPHKGEATGESTTTKGPGGRHAWEAPYLVAFLFLSLIATPFVPFLLHGDQVDRIEYVGQVQRVRYVGGFATNTQIDVALANDELPSTQWRSFLLRRIAHLPPHAPVELRVGTAGTQICIQHTEQCWALLGY